MSDYYNDPNLRRRGLDNPFDPATVWAGFAALTVLVVVLGVIGVFAGGNTQTTSTPAMQTTGSGYPTGSALPHSGKRQ